MVKLEPQNQKEEIPKELMLGFNLAILRIETFPSKSTLGPEITISVSHPTITSGLLDKVFSGNCKNIKYFNNDPFILDSSYSQRSLYFKKLPNRNLGYTTLEDILENHYLSLYYSLCVVVSPEKLYRVQKLLLEYINNNKIYFIIERPGLIEIRKLVSLNLSSMNYSMGFETIYKYLPKFIGWTIQD